ncbi:MAG: hypothetical protein HY059_09405 [Proteobacteria bacterium]|nr:hypothetical protein [Pseudomonadota bacterium]
MVPAGHPRSRSRFKKAVAVIVCFCLIPGRETIQFVGEAWAQQADTKSDPCAKEETCPDSKDAPAPEGKPAATTAAKTPTEEPADGEAEPAPIEAPDGTKVPVGAVDVKDAVKARGAVPILPAQRWSQEGLRSMSRVRFYRSVTGQLVDLRKAPAAAAKGGNEAEIARNLPFSVRALAASAELPASKVGELLRLDPRDKDAMVRFRSANGIVSGTPLGDAFSAAISAAQDAAARRRHIVGKLADMGAKIALPPDVGVPAVNEIYEGLKAIEDTERPQDARRAVETAVARQRTAEAAAAFDLGRPGARVAPMIPPEATLEQLKALESRLRQLRRQLGFAPVPAETLKNEVDAAPLRDEILRQAAGDPDRRRALERLPEGMTPAELEKYRAGTLPAASAEERAAADGVAERRRLANLGLRLAERAAGGDGGAARRLMLAVTRLSTEEMSVEQAKAVFAAVESLDPRAPAFEETFKDAVAAALGAGAPPIQHRWPELLKRLQHSGGAALARVLDGLSPEQSPAILQGLDRLFARHAAFPLSADELSRATLALLGVERRALPTSFPELLEAAGPSLRALADTPVDDAGRDKRQAHLLTLLDGGLLAAAETDPKGSRLTEEQARLRKALQVLAALQDKGLKPAAMPAAELAAFLGGIFERGGRLGKPGEALLQAQETEDRLRASLRRIDPSDPRAVAAFFKENQAKFKGTSLESLHRQFVAAQPAKGPSDPAAAEREASVRAQLRFLKESEAMSGEQRNRTLLYLGYRGLLEAAHRSLRASGDASGLHRQFLEAFDTRQDAPTTVEQRDLERVQELAESVRDVVTAARGQEALDALEASAKKTSDALRALLPDAAARLALEQAGVGDLARLSRLQQTHPLLFNMAKAYELGLCGKDGSLCRAEADKVLGLVYGEGFMKSVTALAGELRDAALNKDDARVRRLLPHVASFHLPTEGLARKLARVLAAGPGAEPSTQRDRTLLWHWHGDGASGSASYAKSVKGGLELAAFRFEKAGRADLAAAIRSGARNPGDAGALLDAMMLAGFRNVSGERMLRVAREGPRTGRDPEARLDAWAAAQLAFERKVRVGQGRDPMRPAREAFYKGLAGEITDTLADETRVRLFGGSEDEARRRLGDAAAALADPRALEGAIDAAVTARGTAEPGAAAYRRAVAGAFSLLREGLRDQEAAAKRADAEAARSRRAESDGGEASILGAVARLRVQARTLLFDSNTARTTVAGWVWGDLGIERVTNEKDFAPTDRWTRIESSGARDRAGTLVQNPAEELRRSYAGLKLDLAAGGYHFTSSDGRTQIVRAPESEPNASRGVKEWFWTKDGERVFRIAKAGEAPSGFFDESGRRLLEGLADGEAFRAEALRVFRRDESTGLMRAQYAFRLYDAAQGSVLPKNANKIFETDERTGGIASRWHQREYATSREELPKGTWRSTVLEPTRVVTEYTVYHGDDRTYTSVDLVGASLFTRAGDAGARVFLDARMDGLRFDPDDPRGAQQRQEFVFDGTDRARLVRTLVLRMEEGPDGERRGALFVRSPRRHADGTPDESYHSQERRLLRLEPGRAAAGAWTFDLGRLEGAAAGERAAREMSFVPSSPAAGPGIGADVAIDPEKFKGAAFAKELLRVAEAVSGDLDLSPQRKRAGAIRSLVMTEWETAQTRRQFEGSFAGIYQDKMKVEGHAVRDLALRISPDGAVIEASRTVSNAAGAGRSEHLVFRRSPVPASESEFVEQHGSGPRSQRAAESNFLDFVRLFDGGEARFAYHRALDKAELRTGMAYGFEYFGETGARKTVEYGGDVVRRPAHEAAWVGPFSISGAMTRAKELLHLASDYQFRMAYVDGRATLHRRVSQDMGFLNAISRGAEHLGDVAEEITRELGYGRAVSAYLSAGVQAAGMAFDPNMYLDLFAVGVLGGTSRLAALGEAWVRWNVSSQALRLPAIALMRTADVGTRVPAFVVMQKFKWSDMAWGTAESAAGLYRAHRERNYEEMRESAAGLFGLPAQSVVMRGMNGAWRRAMGGRAPSFARGRDDAALSARAAEPRAPDSRVRAAARVVEGAILRLDGALARSRWLGPEMGRSLAESRPVSFARERVIAPVAAVPGVSSAARGLAALGRGVPKAVDGLGTALIAAGAKVYGVERVVKWGLTPIAHPVQVAAAVGRLFRKTPTRELGLDGVALQRRWQWTLDEKAHSHYSGVSGTLMQTGQLLRGHGLPRPPPGFDDGRRAAAATEKAVDRAAGTAPLGRSPKSQARGPEPAAVRAIAEFGPIARFNAARNEGLSLRQAWGAVRNHYLFSTELGRQPLGGLRQKTAHLASYGIDAPARRRLIEGGIVGTPERSGAAARRSGTLAPNLEAEQALVKRVPMGSDPTHLLGVLDAAATGGLASAGGALLLGGMLGVPATEIAPGTARSAPPFAREAQALAARYRREMPEFTAAVDGALSSIGKVDVRSKPANSIEAKLRQGRPIADGNAALVLLKDASGRGSSAAVDLLIGAARSGALRIHQIANYRGPRGTAYLSPEQVRAIAEAAEASQGIRPKIVDGEEAERTSGYTSLQLEVSTESGVVGEIQIKGTSVHDVSKIERLRYIAEEGKEPPKWVTSNRALRHAWSTLLSRQVRAAYEPYLAQWYEYARGLEIGERRTAPVLPDGFGPEMSVQALAREIRGEFRPRWIAALSTGLKSWLPLALGVPASLFFYLSHMPLGHAAAGLAFDPTGSTSALLIAGAGVAALVGLVVLGRGISRRLEARRVLNAAPVPGHATARDRAWYSVEKWNDESLSSVGFAQWQSYGRAGLYPTQFYLEALVQRLLAGVDPKAALSQEIQLILPTHEIGFQSNQYVGMAVEFMHAYRNEDFTAFILAHELAHFLLGHQKSIHAIAEKGPAEIQRLRHRNEHAADKLAIDMVVKAGFNPYAGMDVLRLLSEHFPVAASEVHPALSDRIARMREMAAAIPGARQAPYREIPDGVLQNLESRVPADSVWRSRGSAKPAPKVSPKEPLNHVPAEDSLLFGRASALDVVARRLGAMGYETAQVDSPLELGQKALELTGTLPRTLGRKIAGLRSIAGDAAPRIRTLVNLRPDSTVLYTSAEEVVVGLSVESLVASRHAAPFSFGMAALELMRRDRRPSPFSAWVLAPDGTGLGSVESALLHFNLARRAPSSSNRAGLYRAGEAMTARLIQDMESARQALASAQIMVSLDPNASILQAAIAITSSGARANVLAVLAMRPGENALYNGVIVKTTEGAAYSPEQGAWIVGRTREQIEGTLRALKSLHDKYQAHLRRSQVLNSFLEYEARAGLDRQTIRRFALAALRSGFDPGETAAAIVSVRPLWEDGRAREIVAQASSKYAAERARSSSGPENDLSRPFTLASGAASRPNGALAIEHRSEPITATRRFASVGRRLGITAASVLAALAVVNIGQATTAHAAAALALDPTGATSAVLLAASAVVAVAAAGRPRYTSLSLAERLKIVEKVVVRLRDDPNRQEVTGRVLSTIADRLRDAAPADAERLHREAVDGIAAALRAEDSLSRTKPESTLWHGGLFQRRLGNYERDMLHPVPLEYSLNAELVGGGRSILFRNMAGLVHDVIGALGQDATGTGAGARTYASPGTRAAVSGFPEAPRGAHEPSPVGVEEFVRAAVQSGARHIAVREREIDAAELAEAIERHNASSELSRHIETLIVFSAVPMPVGRLEGHSIAVYGAAPIKEALGAPDRTTAALLTEYSQPAGDRVKWAIEAWRNRGGNVSTLEYWTASLLADAREFQLSGPDHGDRTLNKSAALRTSAADLGRLARYYGGLAEDLSRIPTLPGIAGSVQAVVRERVGEHSRLLATEPDRGPPPTDALRSAQQEFRTLAKHAAGLQEMAARGAGDPAGVRDRTLDELAAGYAGALGAGLEAGPYETRALMTSSGMSAAETVLEFIRGLAKPERRARIFYGVNLYYEVYTHAQALGKTGVVSATPFVERAIDAVTQALGRDRPDAILLDPVANSSIGGTHGRTDAPVSDVRAYLDVLLGMKFDKPTYAALDISVSAPAFRLADLLGGRELPPNLHIILYSSLQKLLQAGMELNTGGGILLVSAKGAGAASVEGLRAARARVGGELDLFGALSLRQGMRDWDHLRSRAEGMARSAQALAAALEMEAKEKGLSDFRIIHPSLESHPDHAVWRRNGEPGMPYLLIRSDNASQFLAALVKGLSARGIHLLERDSYGFDQMTASTFGSVLRLSVGDHSPAELARILETVPEALSAARPGPAAVAVGGIARAALSGAAALGAIAAAMIGDASVAHAAGLTLLDPTGIGPAAYAAGAALASRLLARRPKPSSLQTVGLGEETRRREIERQSGASDASADFADILNFAPQDRAEMGADLPKGSRESLYIVLVPGMGGADSPSYFSGLRRFFEAAGFEGEEVQKLYPDARRQLHSIDDVVDGAHARRYFFGGDGGTQSRAAIRGKSFYSAIERGAALGKRVLVIGHSKGGINAFDWVLDQRARLEHKLAGFVAVASPFGGSHIADAILAAPVRQLVSEVIAPGSLGDLVRSVPRGGLRIPSERATREVSVGQRGAARAFDPGKIPVFFIAPEVIIGKEGNGARAEFDAARYARLSGGASSDGRVEPERAVPRLVEGANAYFAHLTGVSHSGLISHEPKRDVLLLDGRPVSEVSGYALLWWINARAAEKAAELRERHDKRLEDALRGTAGGPMEGPLHDLGMAEWLARGGLALAGLLAGGQLLGSSGAHAALAAAAPVVDLVLPGLGAAAGVGALLYAAYRARYARRAQANAGRPHPGEIAAALRAKGWDEAEARRGVEVLREAVLQVAALNRKGFELPPFDLDVGPKRSSGAMATALSSAVELAADIHGLDVDRRAAVSQLAALLVDGGLFKREGADLRRGPEGVVRRAAKVREEYKERIELRKQGLDGVMTQLGLEGLVGLMNFPTYRPDAADIAAFAAKMDYLRNRLHVEGRAPEPARTPFLLGERALVHFIHEALGGDLESLLRNAGAPSLADPERIALARTAYSFLNTERGRDGLLDLEAEWLLKSRAAADPQDAHFQKELGRVIRFFREFEPPQDREQRRLDAALAFVRLLGPAERGRLEGGPERWEAATRAWTNALDDFEAAKATGVSANRVEALVGAARRRAGTVPSSLFDARRRPTPLLAGAVAERFNGWPNIRKAERASLNALLRSTREPRP